MVQRKKADHIVEGCQVQFSVGACCHSLGSILVHNLIGYSYGGPRRHAYARKHRSCKSQCYQSTGRCTDENARLESLPCLRSTSTSLVTVPFNTSTCLYGQHSTSPSSVWRVVNNHRDNNIGRHIRHNTRSSAKSRRLFPMFQSTQYS